MDLRELRYFRAIAEFGTLSKAAVHLRIAQPALSRHMAKLEGELGIKLLSRTTRGVTLTEAGLLLLDRAAKLEYELQDARREVSGMAKRVAGNLNVSFQAPLSILFIPEVVSPYHRKYPDVELYIRESSSEEMLDRLLTQQIDVAVFDAREHEHADLRSFALWTEELRLVGSAAANNAVRFDDAEATIRELAKLPIIVPGQHSLSRRMIDDAFNREGMRLRPVIEAGSDRLLLELVKAGLGFSFLPLWSIHSQSAREGLWLAEIKPPIRRVIRVVTRRTLMTSRTVAPFLTLIRGAAQKVFHVQKPEIAASIRGATASEER